MVKKGNLPWPGLDWIQPLEVNQVLMNPQILQNPQNQQILSQADRGNIQKLLQKKTFSCFRANCK